MLLVSFNGALSGGRCHCWGRCYGQSADVDDSTLLEDVHLFAIVLVEEALRASRHCVPVDVAWSSDDSTELPSAYVNILSNR